MEITQLEFFLRVVEEGGFTKAAERVYRTQPAVSIAVKRLEEVVGAPLFDRSAKTLTLTDAGRVLHQYAQRIISLRDQALADVNELRELRAGRVRVGANESTSLYLLPDVILAFRELYPDIKVEIFRNVSGRLPREILDRHVDLALMAHQPDDSDIESFPVLRDELVLIMHPEHALAGRESVGVEELGRESFLAHNVRTASRDKVIETFAAHQTPLNIILELATIETIKKFVRKQMGVAIVPRMCVAEEVEQATLASARVSQLDYERTLWAAHRRDAALSHAASAFLDMLRERASIDSRDAHR